MRYLVAVVLFSFLACAEDGKVYVKTDPAGAEITLVNGEGENQKLEVLGKTPSLIKVPLGMVKLIFTLKEHKSATLELDIKDTAIQKPDVVKMVAITYNVDVLYKEEGWNIWADGKDTSKKTPDTIELPFGDHKIVLKKDGFKDINEDINVASTFTLEIKADQIKAPIQVVKVPVLKPIAIFNPVGTWKRDNKNWIVKIAENNTYLVNEGNWSASGTWEIKDNIYIETYKTDVPFPIRNYKIIDNNTLEVDINGIGKIVLRRQ